MARSKGVLIISFFFVATQVEPLEVLPAIGKPMNQPGIPTATISANSVMTTRRLTNLSGDKKHLTPFCFARA
jgi:hypothetical protein